MLYKLSHKQRYFIKDNLLVSKFSTPYISLIDYGLLKGVLRSGDYTTVQRGVLNRIAVQYKINRDRQITTWKIGDQIQHNLYGHGKLLSPTFTHLTILFDNNELMQFNLNSPEIHNMQKEQLWKNY